MTKMKKRIYLSPAIKVVAFQVEHGFAGSPDPLRFGVSEEHATLERPVTQGSELFGRDELTAYN